MVTLKRTLDRARIISYARGLSFLTAYLFVILFLNFKPIFPENDDAWFSLISYSWLNGLGFTNYWGSPIHSSIFNWHGFLQPMLIAVFSPCSTITCVRDGLVILQFLYLVLWIICIESIVLHNLLRYSTYIVGLTVMLQFSARPELLASLELNALFLAYCVVGPSGGRWLLILIFGIVCGLVIITAPAAGLLLITLSPVAVCCCFCKTERQCSYLDVGLGLILIALFVLATVFACLEFIYPYGAALWISGMREHVALQSARPETGTFLRRYVFSRSTPLLVLMAIPLFFVYFESVRSASKIDRFSLAITTIILFLFSLILFRISVIVSESYYNFSVFVPTLVIVSGYLLNLPDRPPYAKQWISIVISTFAVTSGLGTALVCLDKLHFMPKQDRLKFELSALIGRAIDKKLQIAIDPPLIQAIDKIEILKRVDLLYFGKFGKVVDWPNNIDIVIRAQSEFGRLPMAPNGSSLVIDRFDHEFIDRFIWPESLNYAVYKRD